MGWIEGRIQVIEQRVERLYRDVQALIPAIRAAQQQANQGGSVPQSGGGSGGVFFVNNVLIAGTSGTWPGVTVFGVAADVYKVNGGGMVLVTSGASIYNAMPDTTDATKRQIVIPNGDGTYSVVSQSCANG